MAGEFVCRPPRKLHRRWRTSIEVDIAAVGAAIQWRKAEKKTVAIEPGPKTVEIPPESIPRVRMKYFNER